MVTSIQRCPFIAHFILTMRLLQLAIVTTGRSASRDRTARVSGLSSTDSSMLALRISCLSRSAIESLRDSATSRHLGSSGVCPGDEGIDLEVRAVWLRPSGQCMNGSSQLLLCRWFHIMFSGNNISGLAIVQTSACSVAIVRSPVRCFEMSFQFAFLLL